MPDKSGEELAQWWMEDILNTIMKTLPNKRWRPGMLSLPDESGRTWRVGLRLGEIVLHQEGGEVYRHGAPPLEDLEPDMMDRSTAKLCGPG
jgi:hypothetical protein